MSGSRLSCKHCPNSILIESHHAGDIICGDCGVVVGDRCIDVGSEWRTFSDSTNDPSRVGAAENPLLDNDLSTRIATTSTGNEYRHHNSQSSANRTLISAIRDITELADRVNLPKTITDIAATLFKRVHEQRRLRSRPRAAIVTACIYAACRMEKATRSFKELRAVTGVQTGLIAKCYKAICKTLDTPDQPLSTHIDSGDFTSRFCSNLGLPMEVQKIASHITSVVKDRSIADGRNPTSIAAAAIYMASQVSDTKKSQREISEVAGVADSTIKQAYRLMLNRASELIPEDSPFHSRINQLPTS